MADTLNPGACGDVCCRDCGRRWRRLREQRCREQLRVRLTLRRLNGSGDRDDIYLDEQAPVGEIELWLDG